MKDVSKMPVPESNIDVNETSSAISTLYVQGKVPVSGISQLRLIPMTTSVSPFVGEVRTGAIGAIPIVVKEYVCDHADSPNTSLTLTRQ